MNLLSNIPATLPEELTTVLQEGNSVRIERIISTGHRSPEGFWYDQPENEWVMVLQGAARLQFEDRVVELVSGDSISIPAHQKHQPIQDAEGTTARSPAGHLHGLRAKRPGRVRGQRRRQLRRQAPRDHPHKMPI
jgi:cupin 2 domain-containing protein